MYVRSLVLFLSITFVLVPARLQSAPGQSRRLVATLGPQGEPIYSIAFGVSSHLLACGDTRGNIWIWNTQTGRLNWSFRAHSDYVRGIMFMTGDILLSSGISDPCVRLWSLEGRKEVRRFEQSRAGVGSFTVDAEKGDIVAAGLDSRVTRWNTVSQKEIRSLSAIQQSIWPVTLCTDGKLMAGVIRKTNDIVVRETSFGLRLALMAGGSARVQTIAFSADGRMLAAGFEDGAIKIWEVTTGRVRATIKTGGGDITGLEFAPFRRMLASAAGGDRHLVRMWDCISGLQIESFAGHKADVLALAFSQDGRFLATGGIDETVKLWRVDDLLGKAEK